MIILYIICGASLLLLLKSNKINYKKANRLINKGAVILDVRTPDKFRQGHYNYNGNVAINYPLDELENDVKTNNLKLLEEGVYVIYCRSGRRAKIASDLLNKNGYKTFYIVGDYNNLLI